MGQPIGSLPRQPTMYYDDQVRSYNFLAGAMLGVVLGAGIGLILAAGGMRPRRGPRKRSWLPPRDMGGSSVTKRIRQLASR
jgi:gas vesicle protein